MKKLKTKPFARNLFLFAVSILMMSGFFSCKKDSDDDIITLTFDSWRLDDVERMGRINELYIASHPNIRITFRTAAPEVYDSTMVDRFEKDVAGDIIFLRSFDQGRRFYDSAYLLDVTGIIPGLGSFNPMVVNAWSAENGVVYGVPSVGVTEGIYYSKSLFEEYGLTEPATWDEFISVCETLLAGGETVIAQGAADSWTLYELAYCGLCANFYGGEPARQGLMNGTLKMTDDNFLAAFNMVYSLKKYLPPNFENQGYEDMKQLFASGNAAMFMGGSWEISTFEDLGADSTKIGWFAPPVVNPGDKLQYCFHVDAGIGVNKESKHLNEAIEYFKWLAGAEYAQALMNELPGFFSYTPLSATIIHPLSQEMYAASLNADLTVRLMCEKLSAGQPAGNILMGEALNGMMKGIYTPETAAEYVHNKLDTWYLP